ncbi:MAG: dihydrofolate reductase [Proteobacteria bacterium]|nr:dihydrofolate reductase [Pseudomonadota bacterium]
MKIALMAAVAENGVIGRDGGLPWRLPDDLAHLKRLTTGHCIIVGRRTYESVGRALPKRTNLVVTRQPHFAAPGCVVVGSLTEALDHARQSGETLAFVLGGASLYAEALPQADWLYWTRVEAQVEGDVSFPAVDWDEWTLTESTPHPADDRHPHPFRFETYQRNR